MNKRTPVSFKISLFFFLIFTAETFNGKRHQMYSYDVTPFLYRDYFPHYRHQLKKTDSVFGNKSSFNKLLHILDEGRLITPNLKSAKGMDRRSKMLNDESSNLTTALTTIDVYFTAAPYDKNITLNQEGIFTRVSYNKSDNFIKSQRFENISSSRNINLPKRRMKELRKTQLCCQPGSEIIIIPFIFCLIVVVGCFGNILVIAVVFKNKNQLASTTNTFIVNLALADLIFLIFCIPFHAVFYSATISWPLGLHVCKLVHYLQFASMITSVWTLVLMSLDRFLAVAYPIQTKHLRTPRCALVVCLAIWLTALLSATPSAISYQIRVYTHNASIFRQNISRMELAAEKSQDHHDREISNGVLLDADIINRFSYIDGKKFIKNDTLMSNGGFKILHETNISFTQTTTTKQNKQSFLLNKTISSSSISSKFSTKSNRYLIVSTTLCAEHWSKQSSKQAYFSFLLVAAYLLPLASIAGLSGATIGYLWRGSFDMGPNQQSRSVEAKKRGTKLIVAVVIVFAVMWLPTHVVWIWTNFFKLQWKNNYFFYYSKIFSHVFSYANSCINPAVYAFLSTKFRREVRYALACSRCSQCCQCCQRSKTPRNARFTFTAVARTQSNENNRVSQLQGRHYDSDRHNCTLRYSFNYHNINQTFSTTTMASINPACSQLGRARQATNLNEVKEISALRCKSRLYDENDHSQSGLSLIIIKTDNN